MSYMDLRNGHSRQREQQVQRWEGTWLIQRYNKQTSATGTGRRKKRLERDEVTEVAVDHIT